MSEKVKLTKAQYEDISRLKKEEREKNIILHATNPFGWFNESLHTVSLDQFCIALYRPEDITIEQTLEEQLENFYDEQLEAKVEDQVDSFYAIKKTLDIIGMKVKGINA